MIRAIDYGIYLQYGRVCKADLNFLYQIHRCNAIRTSTKCIVLEAILVLGRECLWRLESVPIYPPRHNWRCNISVIAIIYDRYLHVWWAPLKPTSINRHSTVMWNTWYFNFNFFLHTACRHDGGGVVRRRSLRWVGVCEWLYECCCSGVTVWVTKTFALNNSLASSTKTLRNVVYHM